MTMKEVVMTDVYLAGAIAEAAVMVILIARLAAGPTVSDRIVALNTMSTQAALAVILFAAFADRSIYLDVSIWLASFSYLGAIIWARYLERGLL
jgi:multisubunit Na+/H+ antiporter MnhF subunit